LRPGEKLYEELFDSTEKSVPTFHSKLMMALPEIPPLKLLNQYMSELEHAVLNYSVEEVDTIIRNIVPNFRSEKHVPAAMNKYTFNKDMKNDSPPFQEFY
jgi:FlaA1/EpsC-like NDP-sugar epimerase